MTKFFTLICLCASALFFAAPARADSLSLSYFKDSQKLENFKTIIAKSDALSTVIKKHDDTAPLALGIHGEPHWIFLEITRKNPQEPIQLDFGTSDDGRLGFLSNIIVFDRTNGKTLLNSQDPKKFIMRDFTLPPQTEPTTKIIAYIEPTKGHYVAIAPRIVTHRFISLLGMHSYNCLLLLLSFALFAATMLEHRARGALALSAMSLLLFLHRSWLDHYIYLPEPMGAYATPFIWIFVGLSLFITLSQSLRDKYDLPVSLPIGGSILILTLNIVGLLSVGLSPLLSLILLYIPLLLVCFVGGILSSLSFMKEREYHLLSIPLICFLIGFFVLCVFLNSLGVLDLTSFIAFLSGHSLSIGIFISALLFFIPLSFKGSRAAPTLSSQIALDDEDWLKQAQENSEQKRLLKVLQQERALMSGLQESESRRVEEMRLAKEAADEANRAKSAFLAVVSHEIRTPMTGIMGMVRLLLDSALTKEQKDFANTIQDSGEALLSLLNDILDFEKIESGKMDFESVDFDLVRLVKNIHTLMSGHAVAKNISLLLDIDPTLPEIVISDPTRIRQVILNLVNNAIKFTSQGSVTIQLRDLSPNKSDDLAQIYCGIQDSGIGISPEAQRKIFMPFAQADSSTARKYGGTGLGLAICKRLIEQMGGQIGINSRAGEGSTFFFTLSLQKGSADSVVIPKTIFKPTKMDALKPIRILVVDDNGINQKVLSGLLAKGDHKVYLASHADEAMNIINTEPLDLILMDIQLPGKNGFEVTADIRALRDPARAQTPIVAMTGNTRDEDVKACFDAGMNDFLGKPISPELLQSIIIKTITGQYNSAPLTADTLKAIEPTDYEELDDEFEQAVREMEKNESEISLQKEGDTLDFKAYGLNQDVIISLTRTLGFVQTRDILVSFYETADNTLAVLKSLQKTDNFEEIHARAHELKGMAANFGFEMLAHIADDIEQNSKIPKPDAIKISIDQLAYCYDTSKAALNEWLG